MSEDKPKTLSEIWHGMQSKLQSQVQRNLVSPQTGYGINAKYDFPAGPVKKNDEQTTPGEGLYGGNPQAPDPYQMGKPPLAYQTGNSGVQSDPDAGVAGWSSPVPGSFLDKATTLAERALTSSFPLLKATDDPVQQFEMDKRGIPRMDARDVPSMLSMFTPLPYAGLVAKPLGFALDQIASRVSPSYADQKAQLSDLTRQAVEKYQKDASYSSVNRFGDPPAMSTFTGEETGAPAMTGYQLGGFNLGGPPSLNSFADAIGSMTGYNGDPGAVGGAPIGGGVGGGALGGVGSLGDGLGDAGVGGVGFGDPGAQGGDAGSGAGNTW